MPKDGDGDIRARFNVGVEHLVVIHFVDVVARENQHIIRIVLLDEADVLKNGVGRSAVPFAALGRHVRRKDEHTAIGEVEIPRLARADIAVQFKRLILRQNADSVNL